MLGAMGFAQQDPTPGSYKVLKTARVGGEGTFDYIFADVEGRHLYTPRNGPMGHLAVFNLDTLEPVGDIQNVRAGGAVVDPKSHHGFSTTKPITMWDALTLKVIKTIDVDGRPDGIMLDRYNDRVWVQSHVPPYSTVIDAKEGTVVGTVDLGGQPEQAVSDGKGHLYIDLEDKGSIAVVDTKTLKVTRTYDLAGKGGTCAGLAFDAKNHILFATCRNPQTMVILNSEDGTIITTLPIGSGTDGAVFNPSTMEAFSSQSDGTLTVVKENSPTSFVVEQTVKTMPVAKTLTFDDKTNHILLMSADFSPAPPGAPARPAGPPRGDMLTGSFVLLMVGKE
jgi:DNA-binding beta-propeller fold protein YncE